MSDVEVQVTDGAVTVNLGTTGAVSGAASLTTLNRLTKVTGTGEIGLSLILEATIVGALTIAKTGTTARTVTFPDAAITVAGLEYAQTWTAAQTFRTANAIRSEAAATQDAVVIAGRAGGTGSYAATLTPPTLSASITITLPGVTGTLAILGANTFTGAQTLSDVDIVLGTTTGTKIGTAVTQKLGLWNVTPVVQPAAAGQAAAAAQGQQSLTDSTGGSVSTTLAAATNTSALTDSSGGTANTTIAAITNAANAGSADVGPVADGFADIAAQLAIQRSLNTVLINAVASIAAQLALIKTDVANVKTLQDATRTALVAIGAMKGSA